MMISPETSNRATGLAQLDKTCMHAQTDANNESLLSSGLCSTAADRFFAKSDLAIGQGLSVARVGQLFPLVAYAEDSGLGFSSQSPLVDVVMPSQLGFCASRSSNIISL